jgi:hypothetical protein
MGEEALHGLGVAFQELIERQVVLLDHFIEIVYGSHL